MTLKHVTFDEQIADILCNSINEGFQGTALHRTALNELCCVLPTLLSESYCVLKYCVMLCCLVLCCALLKPYQLEELI